MCEKKYSDQRLLHFIECLMMQNKTSFKKRWFHLITFYVMELELV